ncbi:hypothetical protein EGR_03106 [Echinococcus granulosus]|uniref:Uncharacterized protein n=1 Tax=Echinococcus granulosus TaxID=6210 RepID=W6UKM6_ECHGR|nr:hypothetical protein EGR_03106 [Echinococcus granulosus]EUB62085.1 hypothetical protein EGR_03106 [Echinococcus granulosus]
MFKNRPLIYLRIPRTIISCKGIQSHISMAHYSTIRKLETSLCLYCWYQEMKKRKSSFHLKLAEPSKLVSTLSCIFKCYLGLKDDIYLKCFVNCRSWDIYVEQIVVKIDSDEVLFCGVYF